METFMAVITVGIGLLLYGIFVGMLGARCQDKFRGTRWSMAAPFAVLIFGWIILPIAVVAGVLS